MWLLQQVLNPIITTSAATIAATASDFTPLPPMVMLPPRLPHQNSELLHENELLFSNTGYFLYIMPKMEIEHKVKREPTQDDPRPMPLWVIYGLMGRLMWVLQNIITTLYWRFSVRIKSLQWGQNGCDGVSNQQTYDCLFNRLFTHRS